MRNLNVLFLSELFYPHGGGAELATYLYAKLLSQRAGFRITVVTNRFAEEPAFSNHEGFAVYRMPLLRSGSVKYSILQRFDVLLSRFMGKLMKWADVVYIPRFWFSAIPLAKAYRKPVVTHLHDYIPVCSLSNLYDSYRSKNCEGTSVACSPRCIYSWEKRLSKPFRDVLMSTFLNLSLRDLYRYCAWLSDSIICVSNSQKDVLKKHDSVVGRKANVIYNPLPDLPYMESTGTEFGYFGGPSYGKGFHILVESLNYLKSRGITVRVHATKLDDLAYKRIEHESVRRSIIPHGRIDRMDMDRLCRQISCVIVPSIWRETFSYAVVESLIRGKVVIASAVGAIPEVVKDCEGVLLFVGGDSGELAACIQQVKEMDMKTLVEKGLKNRNIATRRFNNRRTIERFAALLENTV